jgi:hypothetical protein
MNQSLDSKATLFEEALEKLERKGYGLKAQTSLTKSQIEEVNLGFEESKRMVKHAVTFSFLPMDRVAACMELFSELKKKYRRS